MEASNLSLAISPGMQEISLVPGETYEGSFLVSNPFLGASELNYFVRLAPLNFEDLTYDISFEEEKNYNQILNWTEIETPTGTLAPKESAEVVYRITVPENAPAGGQYLAFLVGAQTPDSAEMTGQVSVSSSSQIAMLLYSTVSGEDNPSGEVVENTIPLILLDQPLKTSSTIKNTGNVHLDASYVLKVFPLFSNEELYSTEESPAHNTVIPGTSLYSEKTWDDTPLLGIYRVVQEITLLGDTSTQESYTLVCPTWFFFLALFFVAALFYSLIDRSRNRKLKKSKNAIDF